jgi:hypothetical protein
MRLSIQPSSERTYRPTEKRAENIKDRTQVNSPAGILRVKR